MSFNPALQDATLLHSLGVHVLLVVGAKESINEAIIRKGHRPIYYGSQRVTDTTALEAAKEIAGRLRSDVEGNQPLDTRAFCLI